MIDEQALTKVERRLVAAAKVGQPANCSESSPQELADAEDIAHLVRAEVIRDLLLGRHGDLDPRGLNLRSARIVGQLDLDAVHCRWSIQLTNCWLDQPLLARGAQLATIALHGSHMPGLYADGLKVNNDILLAEKFTIIADEVDAAVQLRGAQVGGRVAFTSARIVNAGGPALAAENILVSGGILFNDGFVASGYGELGAIRLVDASIGGLFDCTGGQIKNTTGSALVASRLNVVGDLFLRGEFIATGRSTKSLIRLNSSRLGGLDIDSIARLENPIGPVLGLQNAAVTWVLFPANLTCSSGNRTACEGGGRLLLNGFSYTTLSKDGAEWPRWLHWIRHHTPEYTAQPYQQLATAERSAGHDAAARQILIAQQEDLRDRGVLGGNWATIRHYLWGLLAGYGYRPRRTAVALLFVLLLAGGVGFAAGHTSTRDGRFVAMHTTRTEQPYTPCSTMEQIGLGIDRGLPLGVTGIRDRCDLDTGTRRGQAFTAAIWLLQAAVWALATLTLVGYTGFIRRVI